jgi:putative heme-binding domain-containing protein
MPRLPLLAALCAFATGLCAAEPALVLNDGDRVLLIGDVLIERENNYGHLESAMRQRFPGKRFAVRNLGYSGDSPLGASRASFDPVAKGVDSLKEQLAVVKPTVAILGYGMAASLDDLTYRHNDPVLNPDPARYGLDHSPAKFRRELTELMDLIAKASPQGSVRFVFVGPIRHEDLRASRPGLPDPAEHNALLDQYEQVLRELAAERKAPFVRGDWRAAGIDLAQGTDNGIHLNQRGYRALAASFARQLGWNDDVSGWDRETAAQTTLREEILRKNALFFHRSRPANYTYIFGFRRGEQGRNAVEIPKFDPLVDKAEANVIGLSAGQPSTLPPEPKTDLKLAKLPPLPRPDFKLEPGLEITLFAENPLLEKPVHMNWDSQGRLWVATSNTYPQVNPDDLGAQMEGNAAKFGPSTGNDKIILLEDTNHDGVAESSRIIADKLLIPAGVAPDGTGGCFVGASTELLHLTKPGADGLLSDRRIVFSGFGTEDTHHIIHALHWGVDGRLYFHQTIYIHSHIETPWGLIRANSGTAFAYDPARERLEVHSKGLVNAWGQQEDLAGQTFLTSGADGNGISWGFPGAVLPPSEGARRMIGSISPGSYPKFCGLEIVHSPLFPAEWQGDAITNDFRAHRIVRFAFNDFTADAKPKSGYITKTQPDVVRTSDASFRPIGLSMGPDGGLYVADWTNPIINHGEVDFRDPRRDKQHGRIWRIAPVGSKPLVWSPLAGRPTAELLAKLTSPNRWDFEQARRELLKLAPADLAKALAGWAKDDVSRRQAAWLLSGRVDQTADLLALLKGADAVNVQVALRELGKAHAQVREADLPAIAALLRHANPRVQLEAFRALARIGTPAAADEILAQLPRTPEDSFLDFAAWTSVNEVARVWLADLAAHPDKVTGREAQLEQVVRIADPVVAGPFITRLFAGRQLDAAGTGPWIELIGRSGGPAELTNLFGALTKDGALQPAARVRAAGAMVEAAAGRNARPNGDLGALASLYKSDNRDLRLAALRLSGAWKLSAFIPQAAELAGQTKDAATRDTAFKALRDIGQPATVVALKALAAETQPLPVRRGALIGLSVHAPEEALRVLPDIFAQLKKDEAVRAWQELFTNAAFAGRLAKKFPAGLGADTYAAALQAARGMGRGGKSLVDALTPLTGGKAGARDFAAEVNAMVAAVKKGADPTEGELVYRQNGCALCHAIGGAGGKLGPDLSSIGASAPLDYIVESVLNPAAKVKEGYHGFAFTMKDGSVFNGIPARETATEVIIRPGPGAELAVTKANILKRENIGSLMPAGLVDGLAFVPKRSLFAFLGEIGKPGPFDASKANVARLWVFDDQPPGALAKSAAPTPVYTLINGQLPKAFNPGRLYASAKLTASTAARQPLLLAGVKAAWLDGKQLEIAGGVAKTAIAAGNHTLTVEVDGAAPFFKAQCDDVTFLGD